MTLRNTPTPDPTRDGEPDARGAAASQPGAGAVPGDSGPTTTPPESEHRPATEPVPAAVPDHYDPAYFGQSQDFVDAAAVKKQWDIIKVEKPTKARVFRVHPTLQVKAILLVLKEDNETYLVMPEVCGAL